MMSATTFTLRHAKEEAECGPFTIEQVRSLWATKVLVKETIMLSSGGNVWAPVEVFFTLMEKEPDSAGGKAAD